MKLHRINNIYTDEFKYGYDFFCPKCLTYGHASYAEREPTIRATFGGIVGDDNSGHLAAKSEVVAEYIKLSMKCPVCGLVMEDIDDEMLDPILRFNQRGYKTLFCCKGHIFHRGTFLESMSRPYVTFGYVDEDGNEIILDSQNAVEWYSQLWDAVEDLLKKDPAFDENIKAHIDVAQFYNDEDQGYQSPINRVRSYTIEMKTDWMNDILNDPEYVDGDIYTDAAVRLFMYKRSIFMEFINKNCPILLKRRK